ncbi:GTPase [Cryptococcus wingfieldii CBS 7118]|uniref:Guanine nucleotide-binding protein-like 1 n=1 Tax=Cryptococcus wingfieldii CBS 7118 TaxID=1295528 RepID=A0A1E3JF26_9TREE|nr:GTPase [Cryptococcus wingfieldii CBS 7118]ODN99483.1 GTPase [Cryptococcus wingfieldii CBS 7118]
MPRKVPISNKRRKEQLLVKRALKRGDMTAEEHDQLRSQQKLKTEKKRPGQVAARSDAPVDASSRKLQSKFIALSSDYVVRTRELAYALPLERPLPASSAEFPLGVLEDRDPERRLTCPARPKFRYGQTKKEVEKNEEGVFKKWLKGVEEVVQEYVDGEEEQVETEDETFNLPRGPTWFETNLDVWRVTESSQVLLLLMDTRCPPLHCPPSLRTHLQSLSPNKEIILVLTKSDLVDAKALQGWKQWVKGWWGQEGVQVVSVRSYDIELLREGKGRHKPDIPQQSLDELISALRAAHERLLQPPARVRDDPEKLKSWKAPTRPTVDWAALTEESEVVLSLKKEKMQVAAEVAQEADESEAETSGEGYRRDLATEPFTLGLIGQPNVGKSSLLNALLGEQKVRASRQPGKTKHFQTMFWGSKKEVKIVDCPGLVCPSLAGLEVQALAGIIPISQIPSLPSCLTFASSHLPIETIFKRARKRDEERKHRWSVGGVLEERAIDKGFMTAKGGRPDINRAADGMMRALADGKVRWGFYPPKTSGKEGAGIWLGDDVDEAGAADGPSAEEETAEEDEDEDVEDGESQSDEEELSGSEEDDKMPMKQAGGFFAALEISEDEEDESEDEE